MLISWCKGTSKTTQFEIIEYRKMVKAGFNPKVNGFFNGQAHGFYNKIWSPGKKLVENVVKIIVK